MQPMTKQELLEKRGDLSPFLIHLTRSGDLKLAKDIYSLSEDKVIQIAARKSLESIISARRIEARTAFGYFNYKVPLKRANGTWLNQNSLVKRDWLRAVCFTETPLDHVHLQMRAIAGRQLHFEPYGLAFKESVVRKQNGNPIFYAQTTNLAMRTAFDQIAINPLANQFKSMMPLIEGFGPPWFQKYGGPQEIDFRWEREWRAVGDFSFTLSDVAFGFCQENEIPHFEALVGNQIPFIDPLGDIPKAKAKLRSWKHLSGIK